MYVVKFSFLTCSACIFSFLQCLFARTDQGTGIPMASGQWLLPELISSHWSFRHLGDKQKARRGPRDPPINTTEKPPGLIERLLLSFTDSRDTVVDYTGGSGALLKHAMAIGRNAVIYEKDEEQYTYIQGVVQSFAEDRRNALALPIEIPEEKVMETLQAVNTLQKGVFGNTPFASRVMLDIGNPPQSVLFTVRAGKHLPGEGEYHAANDVHATLVGYVGCLLGWGWVGVQVYSSLHVKVLMCRSLLCFVMCCCLLDAPSLAPSNEGSARRKHRVQSGGLPRGAAGGQRAGRRGPCFVGGSVPSCRLQLRVLWAAFATKADGLLCGQVPHP